MEFFFESQLCFLLANLLHDFILIGGPGGDYRGDPGYPKVGSLEAMPGPEARRLKGTLKGPRTIVLGPEEIAAIKGPGPLRNQRIVLTATGEETKGFIPIVNDEIPEGPESFQIVLQSSENSVYVHKYLKEATVIIEDDDGGTYSYYS